MAARCRECGQFVKVSDPTSKHDHTCSRCWALDDYYGQLGNTRVGCEEAVADPDGTEDACGAKPFGLRVDPEYQDFYAVCRRHYRPPFERCLFEDEAPNLCVQHGGSRHGEWGYCDKATNPKPAPAEPTRDFPSAGATKPIGGTTK